LLKIDLEGVNLAEKEAGDGVATAGDALLVGTGGREGEGACGVGRRDGVELIPAEVDAGFDGMRAAGVDDGVDHLPDGSLEVCEGARGGTKLLEAGQREQRKGIVESGIGGDAGDAERVRCGVVEVGTNNVVAATRVASGKVVDQARGKDMVFVSDSLLSPHVGQARNATGAESCATDQTAAIRQWGNRILYLVVVGVAAEGVVASPISSIDANVELVLMIGVVRSTAVVVGGFAVGWNREAGEERLRSGIERDVDDVAGKLLPDVLSVHDSGGGGIVDL